LMGVRRSSNASVSKHNDTSPGDADLNPLNHLGLRVAMPTLRSTQGYSPHSSHLNISSPFPFSSLRSTFSDTPESDTLPKSAPLSRVGSGWFGKPSGIARTRTASSIHSVGVGTGMTMNGLAPLKHDTTKELSPADLEAETIEQIDSRPTALHARKRDASATLQRFIEEARPSLLDKLLMRVPYSRSYYLPT
ncbi:11315_t:CDS:2, partial [Acaulospora colombiana]